MKKTKLSLAFLLFFCFQSGYAQTWAGSLDVYAREVYLPANKYRWKWQSASFLSVMVKQYDKSDQAEKKIYLDYVKRATDKTYGRANGKSPNAVASGLGMAFLYRVTGDEKYKLKCDQIFNEYLKTRRTAEGAVSHLSFTLQLWDDTVFMIGEFLLGMYRATHDEKYLDELATQIKLHRDKLRDEEWGLWYHGWDSDAKSRCTFCGQWNWPDKATGNARCPNFIPKGFTMHLMIDVILQITSGCTILLSKTKHLMTEIAGILHQVFFGLKQIKN